VDSLLPRKVATEMITTAVKTFSDFCQTLSSGQRVGDSLKEVPMPATYIAMVECAVATYEEI